MSWIKRKWKRLLVRMLREKASAAFIARGWAIGMFYGLTIPFGCQLILSIPTALVLKGSKIGAVVGTFVTNHFTIFIIYPFQILLGDRLVGGNLSWENICGAIQKVCEEQTWNSLLSLGGELVRGFFIGGFALAAVAVPLTYFGILRFVTRQRARQQARRSLRAARRRGKEIQNGSN